MYRIKRIGMGGLLCVLAPLAALGGPAPPDDLEPAVDTSAVASQPAVTSAPAARTAVPAASGAARGGIPAAGAPPQPAAGGGAGKAATKAPASGKALDRVALDATKITGNRELPKVMYVVPWKRADLGDSTGRPANSLVDEVLEPVDRDVFNRENRYYRSLAPEGDSGSAPGPKGRE